MNCPSCQASNEDAATACGSCGRSLGSLPLLSQGTLVAGRYEIADALGRGGMGTVYRAHDRMLDEPVAIKVLRSEPEDWADRGRRFRSEIKLARKVTHRNVCRIHEYGEDGPLRYICMELIAGTDLRRLLDRRGRLPPREAFDIAMQVAAGLEAIHQVGVIHRDLKPSNIMLDGQGVVKLMDFGIAKQGGPEGDSGATGTGTIVGTPDYMSPEQARGERIDVRSDVYCLGVVTYELFTGARLFKAPTPLGTILMHLNEPAPLSGPLASRIPAPVVPVLERALAKDREVRYARAGTMLEALERASAAYAAMPDANPMPPDADPPAGPDATTFTSSSISPLTLRPKRRWPAAAMAGIGVGAVALVIFSRPLAEKPSVQEPQIRSIQAPAISLPAASEAPPTTAPPRSQPVSPPKPPPVAASAAPVRPATEPSVAAVEPGDSGVTQPRESSPSPAQAAPPSTGPPAGGAPGVKAPAAAEERAAVAEPGNAPPAYPRDARAKGLEGQVTLKVSVSETGKVDDVTVLSGEEPFVTAALDAVKQWRYSPATRDGRVVPSDVIVRMPFRLRKKG
jgi:serine/threonine-protein kinase